MSAKDKRNIIIVSAFFALLWGYIFFIYSYHFVFKEQMTLFMLQGSYLFSFLGKPAFFSRIIGEFFTQFFIFQAGAATVMVAFLALAWWGMRKSLLNLGVTKNPSLFALFPVAAEAALSCILEYPLSMLVGFTTAVWLFAGCSCIRNKLTRRAVSVVALAALYPLVGGHFLAFLVLTVLFERKSPVYVSILSVSALALTFLYGRLYLLTPYQTFFFPIISGYMFRYPYWFLLTEAAVIFSFLLGYNKFKWWVGYSLAVVAAVVGLWVVYEGSLEYDLKISTEAYFGHWDKVSALGRKNKRKTMIGAYYRNIALAREGRLADELMNGYQPLYHGLFIKIKEDVGYIKAFDSVDALMECGDMAQAQHSALLGMTFTPEQHSSRMARKLAEIAVANGDFAAARKYFEMLRMTLFHKNWAEDALKLMENSAFKPLHARSDILFSPNDYYSSLKNILKNEPYNRVALDYLLCFNLLNKDLKSFRENYDIYAAKKQKPTILYQEALLMTMEEKEFNVEGMRRYNITPNNLERCLDYIKIYEQNGGDGTRLSVKYGQTYWFYFYYAQERKK